MLVSLALVNRQQTLVRYGDLCRLAEAVGVDLTPTMRRDWTRVGFLAPSTPEGRRGLSGAGVGRYWTPEQAQVYQTVLGRYAEQPRPPRYALANLPLAFWLLLPDGEVFVPLVQVRRALATFAAAAWKEERIRRMVTRHALALPKAAAADLPLQELIEEAVAEDVATRPLHADSEWLVDALTRRTAVDRATANRIREDSKAALRGLATFRELDDDVFRLARERYRDTYLPKLAPDVLAENSCADLLTVLGAIAGERGLA